MCFIDLRVAFDNISRQLLYKILRMPTKVNTIVNVIEKVYQNTSGYISGTSTDKDDVCHSRRCSPGRARVAGVF